MHFVQPSNDLKCVYEMLLLYGIDAMLIAKLIYSYVELVLRVHLKW